MSGRNAPYPKSACPYCGKQVALGNGQARVHHMRVHVREQLCTEEQVVRNDYSTRRGAHNFRTEAKFTATAAGLARIKALEQPLRALSRRLWSMAADDCLTDKAYEEQRLVLLAAVINGYQ
jgi:competence CoiA-like predicted nuclease